MNKQFFILVCIVLGIFGLAELSSLLANRQNLRGQISNTFFENEECLVLDIDESGFIDIADLSRIGARFGETGEEGWIPEDIDFDGIINIIDLALVARSFGDVCVFDNLAIPEEENAPLPSLEVWPGDTNNDGIVDERDVLPIGTHWNKRGPARNPASSDWRAWSATTWQNPRATYADANGDGLVDARDKAVIELNWRKSNPSAAESVFRGDANGDGRVACDDQMLASRFSNRLQTPTAAEIGRTDMDNNGTINLQDVIRIGRALSDAGVRCGLGDADRDGKVTCEDAYLTLKYAIGAAPLLPGDVERLDVTNDGKISSADARFIALKTGENCSRSAYDYNSDGDITEVDADWLEYAVYDPTVIGARLTREGKITDLNGDTKLTVADVTMYEDKFGVVRSYKLGDVNGDGIAGCRDPWLAMRYAFSLETLTPEQIRRGDFSRNGELDVHDASLIARKVVALFSVNCEHDYNFDNKNDAADLSLLEKVVAKLADPVPYGVSYDVNVDTRVDPLDLTAFERKYNITRPFPRGDADGDGKLTCLDVQLIMDSSQGYIPLSSEKQKRADFSGDGTVSAYDVAFVLQAAGLSCPAYVPQTLQVWPGDTNNDEVVDERDVLPLGTYVNYRGSARNPLSSEWRAWSVESWRNIKATYADANGDGVVSEIDKDVITSNWHKTRVPLTTTDLELRSITRSQFDPNTLMVQVCVQGSKSLADLKKENPNVSGFPLAYYLYSKSGARLSTKYPAGAYGGPIEEIKNGQCSTYGVLLREAEAAIYGGFKKIDFVVDPDNLIVEKEESGTRSFQE